MILRKLVLFSLSAWMISCGTEPTPTYTISTASSPTQAGSVSYSPTGSSQDEGTSITFTATPSEGYLFSQWQGDLSGTTNPASLTLNKNVSVTGVFEKRTYPLTITIEGEGTVKEEVIQAKTDYEHGTTVRLTAQPKTEWNTFSGWSGDVSNQEISITLTITNPVSVRATFQEQNIIVNENIFTFPLDQSTITTEELRQTINIVSGPFQYSSSGKSFMMFPGQAIWIAGRPDQGISQRTEENKVPSFSLIKVDNKWEYHDSYPEASFWGPRSFELIDNVFFIADGNEIGDPNKGEIWEGDLYMGEIVQNGRVNWTRVNNDDEMGYFHGLGVGDLNGDGLLDAAVTPGINRPQLFYQNQDRTFTLDTTKIRVWTQNLDGGPLYDSNPFAIQIGDLNEDNVPEIVTASYGGGDPSENEDLNDIRIYQLNNKNGRYEMQFRSRIPSSIYNIGLGATSIKVIDVNKDGFQDLIVAREAFNNQFVNTFEVWLGKSNLEFDFAFGSPVYSEETLMFREFLMMDVNRDNYEDLILRPHAFGSLYRVNPNNNNIEESGGVKLNHLIWINDRDGTFSHYSTEELTALDVRTFNLYPYMENDVLHFMGIYSLDLQSSNVLTTDLKVRILN
jgi:hypothetical protein